MSRVVNRLLDPGQLAQVQQFRQLYSSYEQNRDLINVGAYTRGSDPRTDLAIDAFPHLQAFLQQGLELKTLSAAIQAQ